MDTPRTPNKLIIAAAVIVLLVAAGAVTVAISQGGKTSTQTTQGDTAQTQTADTSASGTNNATASSGNYKDGTYSATGTYQTPGGSESIKVTVTLASGVVTSADVTQNASGGEAEEYQSKFVSGYKSQVVGKKISEISLSRVAGSSLTPIGFNAALQTIKSDAQS